MTIKKNVNTNDPDQSHLQLLNALSIVLVRQHEVVSVVSNHSSGHLDLLACSQPDIYYVTADPRIVNPKGRSRENEAHIAADALRYCGQHPRILKARPELIQSVNVMWYMHTAQSGQSFEVHAEIIVCLLCEYPQASPFDRKALAVYTAGSSWRQAYFQLKHPIYSMPFFDALLAIKTFEYKQVPPSSSKSRPRMGDFLR
ncbi:hypothetical protein L208DRAFT_557304 [Tricholoma matsutake]|nr:hypothetical protein L208DRAFT_557304 [Tricholoma matsutake 945]